MELITRLSGLLKAITHTIRVMFRINFKTVRIYENLIVQCSVSPYMREVLFGSFAAIGFSDECVSCKCAKQRSKA
jgi:hypothetical protein